MNRNYATVCISFPMTGLVVVSSSSPHPLSSGTTPPHTLPSYHEDREHDRVSFVGDSSQRTTTSRVSLSPPAADHHAEQRRAPASHKNRRERGKVFRQRQQQYVKCISCVFRLRVRRERCGCARATTRWVALGAHTLGCATVQNRKWTLMGNTRVVRT